MRMNGEKDEFLFLGELRERRGCFYSFSKGWLVAGEWDQLDSKQIIEA